MKKLFTLIATILILLSTSILNAQAPRTKRKITPKTVAPVNGMLYKISGKQLKKPSYLFGTVHRICPKDMIPVSRLNPYLSLSKKILLELDLDDPDVMAQMAAAFQLPNERTIQDLLTPEQYKKVDEMFLNVLGVPVEKFKRLSPFVLMAVIITSPKFAGCSGASGYDTAIAQVAKASALPLDGLESVDEAMSAIEKIPLEKHAEGLYKLALDPEKAMSDLKELIDTYKLQDDEKLFRIIEKQSAEYQSFQQNLLDDRNKAWLPKIEKEIGTKSVFIAVGGGHLGGASGLVKMLRDKGYVLTAIRL